MTISKRIREETTQAAAAAAFIRASLKHPIQAAISIIKIYFIILNILAIVSAK
jgi:hypothetical protein